MLCLFKKWSSVKNSHLVGRNPISYHEHAMRELSVNSTYWHEKYDISKPKGFSCVFSKGTFTHTRAGAGGKLASTQIITCVHTCAVAERRRSGSKNRSARNGPNTQFTAPASKPRAPNHHCPQEMADPPASAPRMCELTRGSAAGISKSTRLRCATAPGMCERRVILVLCSSFGWRN